MYVSKSAEELAKMIEDRLALENLPPDHLRAVGSNMLLLIVDKLKRYPGDFIEDTGDALKLL